MKDKFDIRDDELRIIGRNCMPAYTSGKPVSPPKKASKRPLWIMLAAVVIIIAGIIIFVFTVMKSGETLEENGLFEQVPSHKASIDTATITKRLGTNVDPTARGFTEKRDTTINDIPLSIYIPHNATAELYLRTPDINDKNIIFCAQAADIRRDNKKIVGAFVLKGTPLAWGLSKKGYCAIIDGKITIGVADNSPLFEEATEKGGYFFRQYPLVDNGRLIENEPKNKSIRKALCDRNGEIFIVISNTPESFHDFAQALVDLSVDNAIYIVGGEYAKGWYQNANGETFDFSKARRDRYKNENYIVWRTDTTGTM